MPTMDGEYSPPNLTQPRVEEPRLDDHVVEETVSEDLPSSLNEKHPSENESPVDSNDYDSRYLGSVNESSSEHGAPEASELPPDGSPHTGIPGLHGGARQSVLSPWLSDIYRLLVSILLLAAIYAVLLSQNNKLQRDWNIHITLNSIANILSTFLRASIATVAAEIICQTRWTWFWSVRRSDPDRRMLDLQHFTNGSRDAFAALQLAKLVKWRSPLTLMATIIFATSFAIGPFVQQAIRTVERTVPEAGKPASIPIARNISVEPYFLGDSSVVLKASTVNALQAALLNPSGIKIVPNCPTGNCTFTGLNSGVSIASIGEITHASAGICAECTDVSSLIAAKFDESTKNLSLPNGMELSLSQGHETEMIFRPGDLSWAGGIMSENARSLAGLALSNTTVLAVETASSDGHNKSTTDSLALSCSFNACLRSYSGMVQGTELREELLSQVPMHKSDGSNGTSEGSHVAPLSPCLENDRNFTAEAIAEGRDLASSWAPQRCTYGISTVLATRLGPFLDDTYNATCLWCEDQLWLSDIWSMADRFAELSTALTNQFRLGLGDPAGSQAKIDGQALYWKLRSGESVWKSSVLPLIYYTDRFRGDESQDLGEQQALMSTKEMEDGARETRVQFSRVREEESKTFRRIVR
ncbi:short-chain dehydrogenase [Colletotrichum asianum]